MLKESFGSPKGGEVKEREREEREERESKRKEKGIEGKRLSSLPLPMDFRCLKWFRFVLLDTAA